MIPLDGALYDPTLVCQSGRIAWLAETGGQCQFLGISPGTGALLGGVTSAAGGKKQAGAATQAAQIQAAAAQYAARLQQQRFEEGKALMMPFIDYGTSAIPSVQALTGTGPGASPTAPLTAPLTSLPPTWSPTMEDLAKMPGYQFELQQGMLGVNAQMAASGLGRSGAAAKAGASYAQGLAASDWQANYNQWLSQQNLTQAGKSQTYNMLTGQVGTGLSGAGAVLGVGVQSAANQAAAIQAAGAAQASGIVGASNALYGPQGGITQLGQSFALASMLGGQGTSGYVDPYTTSGVPQGTSGLY